MNDPPAEATQPPAAEEPATNPPTAEGGEPAADAQSAAGSQAAAADPDMEGGAEADDAAAANGDDDPQPAASATVDYSQDQSKFSRPLNTSVCNRDHVDDQVPVGHG